MLAEAFAMNRSLLALVLAPLALVIACGSDDGSGDAGLFQSSGGEGGKRTKAPIDHPRDEPPHADQGAGGAAGTTTKGGSGGHAGATSKGGSSSGAK